MLPLLVCILPDGFDAEHVQEMAQGYEKYFAAAKKYALITHTEGVTRGTFAKERRLIGDWASQPRIRDLSRRLCVASTAIVASGYERAILTAILWFWKPPSPFQVSATADEAINFCLAALEGAGIPLPAPAPEVRAALRPYLRQSFSARADDRV
jgi:hypothetical protein